MSAELLPFVRRRHGFPVSGRAEHVPGAVPGGGIDQKMENGHPKGRAAVLHAAGWQRVAGAQGLLHGRPLVRVRNAVRRPRYGRGPIGSRTALAKVVLDSVFFFFLECYQG